jgi:prepilin-type N-terminal cleavage/methylation domain-containing protein
MEGGEKHMFKMKGKAGFTLVEIMIVVAIIGLLAAIAIPSFMKARTTARLNACKAQRTQIVSAIERYAMDANLGEGDSITASQGAGSGTGWAAYLKDGIMPECSAGTNGVYTYSAAADESGSAGTVGTYTIVCPNFNASSHDCYSR